MGEMGENNLSYLLVCSCMFNNILWYSWSFYYSEMANEGPRTYSNTFWIIFGTSKNVTKCRPPGHLFITKILQTISENMDTFYKT